MDYSIENGTIIDGLEAAPFRGDLLIHGERLTAIHTSPISAHRSEGVKPGIQRIDATGCYVSPGFIDAHSHADLAPFTPEKLELKLRQGVSTEVVGQCGFSPAPMPAERQEGWLQYYVPGSPLATWPWESSKEFYSALQQQGLPLNFMPFVGHGTLRYAVKGDSSAPMSSDELDRMDSLLAQAFAEGAAGLSFGLIYVPALFAQAIELQRAARCAARHQRILTVHMRSESDELIEALEEMITLTQKTGVRLHISHLKAIGPQNQKKIDKALELIEANQLSFDSYPYTYGSTSLLSMLPPQLFQGRTVQAGLLQLTKPQVRKEVEALLQGETQPPAGLPWDNLAQLLGWEKIELSWIPEGPDHDLQGCSLMEAAELRSISPVELTLQLSEKYGGQVRIIDEYSCEETLQKIITHPAGITSSDTLLGGRQHPRTAGSFARMIAHYSRPKGSLNLETAVHRMTGRSAARLGLKNRGFLRPGAVADIAVWKPDLMDTSTRMEPEKPADGLTWLLINGQTVIAQGNLNSRAASQQAGKLLLAPEEVLPQ